MEEKTGAKQLDDLERGNIKTGSSSMNFEITKASASTPNEPPTTATPHENTVRKESENPQKSKKCEILGVILLIIVESVFHAISLVVEPVFHAISLVCYIVRKILAPKRWTILVILEWIALLCLTGFLVAILNVHELQNHLIWEFELWKWCVMIMVLVCGGLVSEWIVNAVFLLTDAFFAHKIKVYYFVYGLKKKHGVFVWWGLILLAWLLLVDQNEEQRGGRWRSKKVRVILDYITRGIASLFVGAGLWLLKDLFVWWIALSFQSKKFFDKVLKAAFHQSVIKTLRYSSWYMKFQIMKRMRRYSRSRYRFSSWAEEIRKGKASAVSIKVFIDVISSDDKLKIEDKDAQSITDEIFANGPVKDSTIITKENFLSFYMIKEDEFDLLFPNHSHDKGIQKEDMKKWLEETVFEESKSLESSLNNASRALKELEKIATGIVLVVIILVSFVVLKVLTTQAVLLILTQFFVLAFIFGDTCKRTFEGIFFLFATNPFDVGDRCFIEDGEEMFVEKINIQTTIFSRNLDDADDKEKIVYPNSVLAGKYIRNFHKAITDSIEFAVDAPPSIELISDLEAELKKVMEKRQWKIKDLRVHVNGFEDGEKIKMGVYVTHEHIRSDDEKRVRKTVMILELRQILKKNGVIIHSSSKTQQ